jgi:hypothetical protein
MWGKWVMQYYNYFFDYSEEEQLDEMNVLPILAVFIVLYLYRLFYKREEAMVAHNDLHAGNILVSLKGLGIIDFGKVCILEKDDLIREALFQSYENLKAQYSDSLDKKDEKSKTSYNPQEKRFTVLSTENIKDAIKDAIKGSMRNSPASGSQRESESSEINTKLMEIWEGILLLGKTYSNILNIELPKQLFGLQMMSTILGNKLQTFLDMIFQVFDFEFLLFSVVPMVVAPTVDQNL